MDVRGNNILAKNNDTKDPKDYLSLLFQQTTNF